MGSNVKTSNIPQQFSKTLKHDKAHSLYTQGKQFEMRAKLSTLTTLTHHRIISTVKQLPGFVYDKYFGGIEGPTGKTSRMNMSEGGC